MMEHWNIGLTKNYWVIFTTPSFHYSIIPELSLKI
jgi:hypothetical protein